MLLELAIPHVPVVGPHPADEDEIKETQSQAFDLCIAQ
jgi:hypothetical protein